MKKIGRIIVAAILVSVALTGCKIDGDYNLKNIDDDDIKIGNVIEGPIGTATFYIEQLVGDLIQLLADNGLDTSEWDNGGQFPISGFPQSYTTDPIDISLGMGDDITELLTKDGELKLIVQPQSALSFNADLKIMFGDGGGTILELGPIKISPENKKAEIVISDEDLNKISESENLKINFEREDGGEVSISKNDFVKLKLSVSKTGGIGL